MIPGTKDANFDKRQIVKFYSIIGITLFVVLIILFGHLLPVSLVKKITKPNKESPVYVILKYGEILQVL